MPPSTNLSVEWSNLLYFSPYPLRYGCIFQLLRSVEAPLVWSTRQLCHFPVETLQKVQELGHMGYDAYSTLHHGLILLF
jgi:hypothetical protein